MENSPFGQSLNLRAFESALQHYASLSGPTSDVARNALVKAGVTIKSTKLSNRNLVIERVKKIIETTAVTVNKKCVCGHSYKHNENYNLNGTSCCKYCSCTKFRCEEMSEPWKLFLDDERIPVDSTEWVICRSIDDVMKEVDARGFPFAISFDHDLGLNDNGLRYRNDGLGVAQYLVDQILDNRFAMPENFSWYVHSQNPVGKENIESLLANFMTFWKD